MSLPAAAALAVTVLLPEMVCFRLPVTLNVR